MSVTNKVPNSKDKSTWQGDSGYGDFWYLKLNANSGYKFDGNIIAKYTDTSKHQQTLILTPRNSSNLEVWEYVYNTDKNTAFVITGKTRLDNELEVTNKITNTTVKGVKKGIGSGSVNVTANEGFKITSAKVAFTDGKGYPNIKDMTISEDGKNANWSNEDCNTVEPFTVTGETASEGIPELTVKNEIADTTEQHTYDGQTVNFTVNGSFTRYRFKQPTVNYTGTDGQPKAVQMKVEVLERGSIATATVTDIDPTKPVTIKGQYLNAIMIEPNLSNCYADPELPEYFV